MELERTNCGNGDVIDIATSKIVEWLEDKIHETLLSVLSADEAEGHAAELITLAAPAKCGLLAVLECDESLEIGALHVDDCYVLSVSHPLDVLVDARKSVRVADAFGVQRSEVEAYASGLAMILADDNRWVVVVASGAGLDDLDVYPLVDLLVDDFHDAL